MFCCNFLASVSWFERDWMSNDEFNSASVCLCRSHGQGGMIVDPLRSGFPRSGFDPSSGIPGVLPPGAVPPGARFDPFGPVGQGRPGWEAILVTLIIGCLFSRYSGLKKYACICYFRPSYIWKWLTKYILNGPVLSRRDIADTSQGQQAAKT